MIERNCKQCGRQMLFDSISSIRRFCSRDCFNEHRRKMYTTEDDDGVVMPPLENICDEGYTALVAAIVSKASSDVLNFEPGTVHREDAVDFFLSDYFYELTNLDGFEILDKLTQKYDEKQRKKEAVKA